MSLSDVTSRFALGTFRQHDRVFSAIVADGMVFPLEKLGIPLSSFSDLRQVFMHWDEAWPALAAAAVDLPKASGISESELVAVLPLMPGQVLGAGANYRKHVIDLIVDHGAGIPADLPVEERRKHAIELMDHRAAHGTPYVFVAPQSAVSGPDIPLILPYDIKEPDWELELGVVISKSARRVSVEEAMNYVGGYVIANDLTARELVDRKDLRQMGMDWMACKGTPGFKVIGPLITPAAFVPDPQNLHIRLMLNGQVMQDEGTSDMIFSVARIISYISQHVQLGPGDVIMTGSPSGNGTHYGRFLRDGDVMEGSIDGLSGVQRIVCVAEQPASSVTATSKWS